VTKIYLPTIKNPLNQPTFAMFSAVSRQFRGRYAGLFGGAAAVALASASFGTAAHLASASAQEPLDPEHWRGLKLLSQEQLTGGDRPTHLLRFELPASQPPLPVASALLVRMPVGKEKDDGTRAFVLRPYTPVSASDAKTLDLALKIYPDGKLTPHLGSLKPGDVLDFKGPLPKIPLSEVSKHKSIGMISGGTGITPMLQVATELLRNKYSGTINLIYANVSPSDIMLKDRLDALAKSHSNFKVYYVVDKAEKGWTGGVGYVTAEMLKERMPVPSAESLVLVCGPPGMMKVISGEKVSPKEQGPLTGLLKEKLGYTESQVYKF
jgi:cytochrome-b5 reductase